jgi:transposase-like protein
MDTSNTCNIISVGKRRDGGTRYWCLKHKADATAKYGVKAEKCRYADIVPFAKSEIKTIDLSNYSGGVGLWGAVPPVYDTTRLPIDQGIHVHARTLGKKEKDIDATFRSVELVDRENRGKSASISELEAIYYMISSVFGYPMKEVICTRCGFSHLDKDWFSLHKHQRHLCAGCGQYFRDTEQGIGNPIIGVQNLFNARGSSTKKIDRPISIRQSDYPGGIQVWGSNLSIFWTSTEIEEEGIHLHVFSDENEMPVEDNTYSEVIIDGIRLDPAMVRILMAQNVIPHIAGRVIAIDCPHCLMTYYSEGINAYTPRSKHICTYCNKIFQNRGRLKNVIGNPLVKILEQLASKAPRSPQKHKINLLPETL